MHARIRRLALAASLAVLGSVVHLPQASAATGDYQQVLDVTFPTRPDAWLSLIHI